MDKVYISILNCHPENKLKNGALWLVFKSFCYQIFLNFPKKIRWGTEKSQFSLPAGLHTVRTRIQFHCVGSRNDVWQWTCLSKLRCTQDKLSCHLASCQNLESPIQRRNQRALSRPRELSHFLHAETEAAQN